MTTYQSQTCRTVDRDGNTLTFSTLNEEREDAVLQGSVVVELPDGQQVNVSVLFEADDVTGLLGYLHDNFGRTMFRQTREDDAGTEFVPQPSDLEYATRLDGTTMPPPTVVPGEYCWCGGAVGARTPGDHLGLGCLLDITHNWTATSAERQAVQAQNMESLRTYSPADVVGAQFPDGFPERAPEDRQCPVIYSGVQCTATGGHDFGHQIPGYTELLPQNDAGAATPPADAQGAVNTPQPVAPGQSAAESATGAGTPEAAPASQPTAEAEKPKRKRRTKLEIAYDDALEAHNQAPTDDTWAALGAARAALQAKDPGNQRLAEGIAALQNPSAQPTPDEAQQVGFAPGPLSAGALPVPGQVYSPDENGGIPAQAFSFAPGQTPQLGQVTVSPEEQQAASGFPCPVQSTDGRPCQRPYGHELLTQANPEPKPHVYATADPSQLGQPQPAPVTDPLPWTPNPAQSPGGYIPGDAVTAYEPTFPQGFQPSGQLSFQVPPTPDAAPHPETNIQPPAPAAPSWSAPV